MQDDHNTHTSTPYSNLTLDDVLDWAAAGLPLFPMRLVSGAKRPDGRLAPHGFYSATREAAIIRMWWEQHGARLFAAPMGLAVTIDLDSLKPDFAPGDVDLAEVRQGLHLAGPNDRDGSGHYLFRQRDPEPEKTIQPGKDYPRYPLGKQGFVSSHANIGGSKGVDAKGWGGYIGLKAPLPKGFDLAALPVLPPGLEAALAAACNPAPAKAKGRKGTGKEQKQAALARGPAKALVLVGAACRKLAAAKPQTRYNRAFGAGAALGRAWARLPDHVRDEWAKQIDAALVTAYGGEPEPDRRKALEEGIEAGRKDRAERLPEEPDERWTFLPETNLDLYAAPEGLDGLIAGQVARVQDLLAQTGWKTRFHLRKKCLEAQDAHGRWNKVTKQEEAAIRIAAGMGGRVAEDGVYWSVLWDAHQHLVRTDPCKDWLDSLRGTWDGQERLASFLTDVFGFVAGQEALLEWGGRTILLAVVYRTYEPGFAYKALPVLVGPQNAGKTSLLRALLPAHLREHFVEGLDLDQPHKALVYSCRSAMLVEIGELTQISGAKLERMKNWLSRPTDAFDEKYEKAPGYEPRTYGMVGTANLDGLGIYSDGTGSTRFSTLLMEDDVKLARKIDGDYEAFLDAAAGDSTLREQLWAEAVTLYDQRATLDLPVSLMHQRDEANEAMRASDELEELVKERLMDTNEITLSAAAEMLGLLGPEDDRGNRRLTAAQLTMKEQHRLGRALRRDGFDKIGGGSRGGPKRWRRKDAPTPATPSTPSHTPPF